MSRYSGLLVVILLVAVSTAVSAQEADNAGGSGAPSRFELVFGPRIGVAYVATSQEAFTSSIQEYGGYTGNYIPVVSLFGLNLEQRVLLGDTDSHFAFQELVYVLGMEQSVAIPAGAFLIGFRGGSGVEFGIGPVVSATGLGMLVAAGYTFSARGVFVPVDLSVVLPNQMTPARISLSTGFNFVIDADFNF